MNVMKARHCSEVALSDVRQRPLVSGDTAVLARRYANALYELAEGEKTLDTIAMDLRALRQFADNNNEFYVMSNHPRLTRKQMVAVTKTLAETLKLSPLTGKFLVLVAHNRRLSILPAIIDAFLAELAKKRGEFTASVCSASPLTPQQSETLMTRLAAMAGGKVHMDVREDRSLIGGLTVQIGSRLIDASIRNRLQRLERQLKSKAA